MQLFLTFSQHILVVRKFLDPLILLVISGYHLNQNIVVVRKMSNFVIFLCIAVTNFVVWQPFLHYIFSCRLNKFSIYDLVMRESCGTRKMNVPEVLALFHSVIKRY